MSKKKTEYFYMVEYASGIFKPKNRSNTLIYSNTKLDIDDYIVVEHEGSGLFIARVDEEIQYSKEELDCYEVDRDYKYIQKVDLTKFFADKEKQARKAELAEKMKERFAVIDEKKKFEYYASMDDEMAKMYEEYKQLD